LLAKRFSDPVPISAVPAQGGVELLQQFFRRSCFSLKSRDDRLLSGDVPFALGNVALSH
jgi:hypothetical protein